MADHYLHRRRPMETAPEGEGYVPHPLRKVACEAYRKEASEEDLKEGDGQKACPHHQPKMAVEMEVPMGIPYQCLDRP